ncbi:MAG: hypothetical protein Q4C66_15365 [Lachnospiraceae bacterium]|nr:hypothetical protein [Lachnospiraceae bacterium]
MKKLLSIVLTMALVLSLAGCSKPDPKEIYDAASKKSGELTDMDMTYEADMKMAQGEDTLDMTMSMDMKMVGINTDSMRYFAEGTTSVMGQEVPMSMYYQDGYYYMDSMGQKMKYAMDIETMMEQIEQSMGSANMSSEYLTDITAEKDGDNQILTFTADASKLDSYVQDVMGMMGTGMEGVSYTINEMSGESVVNKEGYFSSSKVLMKMEMTMEGETITMEMDMDVVYHNPGQSVTIDTPDLEGYTEIDPGLLGQ